MQKSEKFLLTLGVAAALIWSVAATTGPSTDKNETWEYLVIKETVAVTGPLQEKLNGLAHSGWAVDAFSTHSTGNGENCVAVLKRRKVSERSR